MHESCGEQSLKNMKKGIVCAVSLLTARQDYVGGMDRREGLDKVEQRDASKTQSDARVAERRWFMMQMETIRVQCGSG